MAFDWTDETLRQLKDLWRDGESTAEIGRKLRTTKNAVIGKAHRLALPPRPSPIRAAAPAQSTLQRPEPPTQETKRQEAAPAATAVPIAPPPTQARTAPPLPFPPICHPPPMRRAWRPGQPRECCWPIGEPGRTGFRFCEASAEAGKPYCVGHCATAYARPHARHGYGQQGAGELG